MYLYKIKNPTKPTDISTNPPKKIFNLKECFVTTIININIPNKSLAFQLADHNARNSIIFVANHEDELKIWLKFLKYHCGYSDGNEDDKNEEKVEIKPNDMSITINNNIHKAVEDIIFDFFFTNCKHALPVNYIYLIKYL